MKEEMIKKIEKLFSDGKITEDVKERLLIEIEDIENKNYEEKFKKSFKNIEIEFVSEDLEIEGRDDINDIIFEKGREGLDIEENNDKLIIKSKNRGVHINVFGIKLGDGNFIEKAKIIIPTKNNLIIDNISGNIEIRNINGNLKLKTVSGDIQIENINGDVDCYTISGDIKIDNIKGEFNVVSKSGDINIRNIEKEGIIKTYSGDIEIKYGNFNKLLSSTFSGDQSLDNININESMEIKTMSGDIDLSLLTKDIKITIETKSGEGSINYEGKLTNINKGEISFGEGDKTLFVKTLSGDINIDID
ncbi:MAG TPA: DUF4097 family beta strand repeat-containing protein [Caldisericia bacterium]|nr:DUF4097 family beta strand repeat-containing protein [Caldisericia bacterium]HPC56290.1 DUF4097 family beta strand repeat-containing protein [Caldisericia bacterium]HPP43082.1 DUF4097 family beta strand repeat-containing protein [Caldisericia bacterium]